MGHMGTKKYIRVPEVPVLSTLKSLTGPPSVCESGHKPLTQAVPHLPCSRSDHVTKASQWDMSNVWQCPGGGRHLPLQPWAPLGAPRIHGPIPDTAPHSHPGLRACLGLPDLVSLACCSVYGDPRHQIASSALTMVPTTGPAPACFQQKRRSGEVKVKGWGAPGGREEPGAGDLNRYVPSKPKVRTRRLRCSLEHPALPT